MLNGSSADRVTIQNDLNRPRRPEKCPTRGIFRFSEPRTFSNQVSGHNVLVRRPVTFRSVTKKHFGHIFPKF